MKYFILCVAFIMMPRPELWAQDDSVRTGSMTVIVLDLDTRQPVVGANVQLAATTIGASTDDQGRAVLKKLPIGSYAVQVSAVGYQKVTRTDLVVNTVKPVEITITLQQEAVKVDEVNVVAGYFTENPDAPVSTRNQSQEELRRLPGGLEDVVRAVSILPGVAQVQAGRNDLVVRGGAPSENLFLVDNIEIPNINHFGTQGASGGPLSYINLDFVEGTSFSAGGFGARYGDKLSSILSINLREGRKDRFGSKATLSASQFGLTVEGPAGGGGSFMFSARRSYLDFIFKAAGFSFVPEYWDFMGKASYNLGNGDKVEFLGIGVLDDIKTFANDRQSIYDNSKLLLNDQRQWIGGVNWQHLFTGGIATVTLSHTINRFNYLQHDTLMQPVFSSIADEGTTALRADASLQMGDYGELSFGLQGTYRTIDDQMYLRPFWTNYSTQISVQAAADTHALRGAGYIQYARSMSIFRLTGGFRADYSTLLRSLWKVSPRASIAALLTSQLTVTASAGRYVQAPSLVWMVSNPLNRNLSYITADQYILSVEHLLREDVKLGVEGYLKRYRDYPASDLQPFITLSNAGAGYGGSRDGYISFGVDPLVSQGWGNSRGLELFFQKKLSESPYYALGSVTYAQAEFAGTDGILRPGSFDQRWIVNFGGGYIVNERWEISGKFRLATGRPYSPYLPGGAQSAAAYNSERIGVNHQLDLRVDRRWSFDKVAIVGFIDVQNVYNNKPKDIPVYNERTGLVEDTKSIGILPSIGLSAEF